MTLKLWFSRSNFQITVISALGGVNDVKQKGGNLIGCWASFITNFWTDPWPWPWISRSNFEIVVCIWGMGGLIDVKWKGSTCKSIGCWADYVTLAFDHTHDLDLKFSISNFEMAVSQEVKGQLTLNGRDMSRSFMTILWLWWGGWMYQGAESI